jgi:hypothetical protein
MSNTTSINEFNAIKTTFLGCFQCYRRSIAASFSIAFRDFGIRHPSNRVVFLGKPTRISLGTDWILVDRAEAQVGKTNKTESGRALTRIVNRATTPHGKFKGLAFRLEESQSSESGSPWGC